MKPVKKINQEKLMKMAQAQMTVFSAEAKARYDRARASYEAQDEETQDAVTRMTNLLVRVARKQMWFTVGKRDDRIILPIPEETVYHNMFYMASEIVKDLAVMDIRVAGYTFMAGVCAECGTEIEPKKKVVKKHG